MPLHTSGLPTSSLEVLTQHLAEHGSPIFRGIEKEGLRVDPSSQITQSDHPAALGHPLTHPHITTDYSEALLELITGVSQERDELLAELEAVHRYVQTHIDDQTLWPASMPCGIDGDASIRIAEYGDSNTGTLKHVYRQGLGVRYGRIMQSIAGLHFNFSLDDKLLLALQKVSDNQADSELSLQDFKSNAYFGLIRNFRRYSWLLMYLFGASPALDQSFVAGNTQHDLEPFDDKGTLYKPYACSLRMGDLGYHNNAQADLNICFNTLENFTSTLGKAIKTPYLPYEEIGIKKGDAFVQLNTNILQIENEYYSSIRPKRTTLAGEKPTQALINRGVEYIEVRCLDLNPSHALGITPSQIDFMDLFLLHCLLRPSGFIDDAACQDIENNFSAVVNEGRKPGLQLTKDSQAIALKDWGYEITTAMQTLAEILDQQDPAGDSRYQNALRQEVAKLDNIALTPSAQILDTMRTKQQSWLEYAQALSQQHQAQLNTTDIDASMQTRIDLLKEQNKQSFEKADALKASDQQDFESYLKHFNAN